MEIEKESMNWSDENIYNSLNYLFCVLELLFIKNGVIKNDSA